MNNCGTCKYFGEVITKENWENHDTIDSTYHKCNGIEHDIKFEGKPDHGAFVDGMDELEAFLKVEADFGCVKWKSK